MGEDNSRKIDENRRCKVIIIIYDDKEGRKDPGSHFNEWIHKSRAEDDLNF